ncbi:MAG: FecR domain-containing protein, partial [Candidatus Promineifilaceae bacterium]
MTEPEDIFQQRLEKLEAGEPLEACQRGLPLTEAALLELAAGLRAIESPVRTPAELAAQRAQLLALAEKNTPVSPSSWLTGVLAWLTARPAAAGALALAAIVVVVLGIGLWPRPSAPTTDMAQIDQADTAVSTPVSNASEADDTAVPASLAAAAMPTQVGPDIFLPMVSLALVTTPGEAALQDVRGLVEVQNQDGTWTAVAHSAILQAGQSLRTGPLSSAYLLFHDGSQAAIGPQSELAITELNALLPADGFRTIVLAQRQGESRHQVQFRGDNGSRYEVQTPGGSGIARGTKFTVSMPTAATARFTVTEGRVEVSQANRTVSV